MHRSRRFPSHFTLVKMGALGARAFVYPNFGYMSIWLRNRDPVYCQSTLPDNGMAQCNLCATDFSISCGGRTDVRRHQESARTARHAKLAKSRSKGL